MSKRKVNVVLALAENFGRTLSLPAAKLFVAALGELSDEQAEFAAGLAARRCKFFPSACELIELARTGGASYEARALIAFEELELALNANEPGRLSPLVAAIVRQLGGFSVLREMPLQEFGTWKRKDFIAAYTTLSKENPERLAAIAGPSSDIAKALVGELKRLPSREDTKRTEDKNRERLLAGPAPGRQR